jgi:hypothetical protein
MAASVRLFVIGKQIAVVTQAFLRESTRMNANSLEPIRKPQAGIPMPVERSAWGCAATAFSDRLAAKIHGDSWIAV